MSPAVELITHHWPEPVRLETVAPSSLGFVAIDAVGVETGRHYSTVLPAAEWQAVRLPRESVLTFEANAAHFRLAIEAERLALAHSCDPLIATNNSRIDALPHQIEAVYGAMLPQPVIRHLMAHDAGAGKTIMAGLLHKELRLRQPNLRTLIVAPAGLVIQWQREMEEKFSESFVVVDREALRADAGAWVKAPRLLTSLSFACQPDVAATLEQVPWDLVIVDEAHHMAAYAQNRTHAYRLGQVLSRRSHHLVLATATPHKGDPDNFLRLLQLLDPGIHDPAIVRNAGDNRRGGPLMLRRLKEEMVDFEGRPLFKPRHVETRWHRVADSPPELQLYIALTEYVSKTYRAAERLGGRERVNVQFAMAMLQRRMNSSFAALEASLQRRRDHLTPSGAVDDEGSVPPLVEDAEDLEESERWRLERQWETATPARGRQERRREAVEIDGILADLAKVRATGEETKVTALRKLLADLDIAPADGGEKLLVFTEFRDTLESLLSLFQHWGYHTTQIHGGMAHEQRRAAERDFRERVQVMVATEAAGEGINLQFCAHMVNYDLPWVPTRLEQRMGRIHRYGQQREARIYNLAAADTREGVVVAALMDRLEQMRAHLGDQVFDVISALVGDFDFEQLLTDVALAPATDESQVAAIEKLAAAMAEGEQRYRQLEEHPFPIDRERFLQMQEASRQSRLTPEYAQHFLVDALEQLGERPRSLTTAVPAGDADAIEIEPLRRTVATPLGLDVGQTARFSFLRHQVRPGVRFAALGTPLLDGALALVRAQWGATRAQGAAYLDPGLPPGESYLLWFFLATVMDGTGAAVQALPVAVRQRPTGGTEVAWFAAAPASGLIDLIPAAAGHEVPPLLLGLARDSKPALDWSLAHQQLPILAAISRRREAIVALRRDCLLGDAEEGLRQAERDFSELAFSLDADETAADKAQREIDQARRRLNQLAWRFDRESACSLAFPTVLGVAAVLSLHSLPSADLPDPRPDVAAAAQERVRRYEEAHGRRVADVSGEHEQYPYDLLSSGPGGTRCIEVKGTTGGRIILSENERRAAKRLGPAYYLYIVTDPLGAARLAIVRDPLSRMAPDSVLHSGVRYAFEAGTWHAAAEEEIGL